MSPARHISALESCMCDDKHTLHGHKWHIIDTGVMRHVCEMSALESCMCVDKHTLHRHKCHETCMCDDVIHTYMTCVDVMYVR